MRKSKLLLWGAAGLVCAGLVYLFPASEELPDFRMPKQLTKSDNCSAKWRFRTPKAGSGWVSTVEGVDQTSKSYFTVGSSANSSFNLSLRYHSGPLSKDFQETSSNLDREYSVYFAMYNNFFHSQKVPALGSETKVIFTPEITRRTWFELGKPITFKKHFEHTEPDAPIQSENSEVTATYTGCGTLAIEGKEYPVNIVQVTDGVFEVGKIYNVSRAYFISPDLGLPLAESTDSYTISAIHVF